MLVKMQRNETIPTQLVGMSDGIASLEESARVLLFSFIKLNLSLPYCQIVPLGIYPRVMKIFVHTKTCAWMSRVASFEIAKIWKQPRCSLIGKWLNQWWYIHTKEYYSVRKRNK